ncbi:MAG: metallophosphoesterase family protein [Deltaproteobacteria bacterium]|nr:metallophosphoesterase family protein [Deltaproteobacteria bacterium]
MRVAVLADVHANLAALDAVLSDLQGRGADLSVCLGDIVGYNARPRECIALVRERVDHVIVGNHDLAACDDHQAPGTHPAARMAQLWTAEELDESDRAWLRALPRKVEGDGWMGVHGCYLNDFHVEGYVTRTMVPANLEAVAAHPDWPKVAFCGHTHIPVTAHRLRGEIVEATGPRTRWPEGVDSVLVNPGAIGQPRDGDWRASYALVDLQTRSVETIRVEYDLEATIAEVKAAGLPEVNHERLRKGV